MTFTSAHAHCEQVIGSLRAEVERLRSIPRMPTHGKHYDAEAGTCSYCHGVGACPECWGRVAIDALTAASRASPEARTDQRPAGQEEAMTNGGGKAAPLYGHLPGCDGKCCMRASPEEGRALRDVVTRAAKAGEPGCDVIWGGHPRHTTCLDVRRDTLEHPDRYHPDYIREMASDDALCLACLARAALRSPPPPEDSGAREAGHPMSSQGEGPCLCDHAENPRRSHADDCPAKKVRAPASSKEGGR